MLDLSDSAAFTLTVIVPEPGLVLVSPLVSSNSCKGFSDEGMKKTTGEAFGEVVPPSQLLSVNITFSHCIAYSYPRHVFGGAAGSQLETAGLRRGRHLALSTMTEPMVSTATVATSTVVVA